MTLTKRHGFKRKPEIPIGKIGEIIKELRRKAHQHAEARRSAPGVNGDSNSPDQPSLRASGGVNLGNPGGEPFLRQMNYVDGEEVLRAALHGAECDFGTAQPQTSCFRGPKCASEVQPEGEDPELIQTQNLLAQMPQGPNLAKLRGHSPYLSSYISAVVLQDQRQGWTYTHVSIDKALKDAVAMGIPEPSNEAKNLMTHESRSGRAQGLSDDNIVYFGRPFRAGELTKTRMGVGGQMRNLYNYGDTAPLDKNHPIWDSYGKSLAVKTSVWSYTWRLAFCCPRLMSLRYLRLVARGNCPER